VADVTALLSGGGMTALNLLRDNYPISTASPPDPERFVFTEGKVTSLSEQLHHLCRQASQRIPEYASWEDLLSGREVVHAYDVTTKLQEAAITYGIDGRLPGEG
jgi:hypothetical protein